VDKKTKQFVGLVRRDQLVALLESGVFIKNSKKLKCGGTGTDGGDTSGAASAPIRRGIFHDNTVSTSFVERNPQIFANALQIRDDRYGSVIENNGYMERCCPTFCLSRDTFFSALAPETRNQLHKEHEWLAETIDAAPAANGDGVSPNMDCTLPRRKIMQGYDGDDDEEFAEQPIVDIDVNRNVVIHLPESVRTREVNVEAVMNRGAHVVLEGCPLSKAYELFTKMGLRHLTVLGGAAKGRVVGIVTRHNLMTEHLEEATGFKLH
jgi:CBS domain-containing protein